MIHQPTHKHDLSVYESFELSGHDHLARIVNCNNHTDSQTNLWINLTGPDHLARIVTVKLWSDTTVQTGKHRVNVWLQNAFSHSRVVNVLQTLWDWSWSTVNSNHTAQTQTLGSHWTKTQYDRSDSCTNLECALHQRTFVRVLPSR